MGTIISTSLFLVQKENRWSPNKRNAHGRATATSKVSIRIYIWWGKRESAQARRKLRFQQQLATSALIRLSSRVWLHPHFDPVRLQNHHISIIYPWKTNFIRRLTSSLRLKTPWLIKSRTFMDVAMKASSTFSPVFADASMHRRLWFLAKASPSWVLSSRLDAVIVTNFKELTPTSLRVCAPNLSCCPQAWWPAQGWNFVLLHQAIVKGA